MTPKRKKSKRRIHKRRGHGHSSTPGFPSRHMWPGTVLGAGDTWWWLPCAPAKNQGPACGMTPGLWIPHKDPSSVIQSGQRASAALIGTRWGGWVHARVQVVTQPCPTLCHPMDCSLPGSSVHGDSPGKNTGVDCHFLLKGIFPPQGSNPGLPRCGWILYCLSQWGRCTKDSPGTACLQLLSQTSGNTDKLIA